MSIVLLVTALGVADLVRWSVGVASARRSALAILTGTAAVVALVLLGDGSAATATGVGVACVLVLAGWVALTDWAARGGPPGWALALIAAAVVLAAAGAGALPPPGGALSDWYTGLGVPALGDVRLEQALAATATLLFLQASANRVVRLVLAAAGTPVRTGESALKGGRLLGPLERIFVFAVALAGDYTAAAIIIAGKGILRLPEIRSEEQDRRGLQDVVAEYFLVGTLTSWLLAIGAALLTSAMG